MLAMGGSRELVGVTAAANCCHVIGMTGLGHKASVGFFGIAFPVNTLMTAGARQLVCRIKFDGVMAPLASDFIRDGNLLALLLLLRFRRSDLVIPTTAEYEEKCEHQGERTIHNLDTIP